MRPWLGHAPRVASRYGYGPALLLDGARGPFGVRGWDAPPSGCPIGNAFVTLPSSPAQRITRSEGSNGMVGRARTVVAVVAAFVLLVVAWELVKLALPEDGVLLGDTRILPRTDD